MGISKQPKLDIHELRRRGLDEIFKIFSRQHVPTGIKFDELLESMSKIDLGEYMKFCKDFEIPLNKIKLQEVFKKLCSFSRNLDIDEFKTILARLGIEMNQQRIKDINMKLKRVGGDGGLRSSV